MTTRGCAVLYFTLVPVVGQQQFFFHTPVKLSIQQVIFSVLNRAISKCPDKLCIQSSVNGAPNHRSELVHQQTPVVTSSDGSLILRPHYLLKSIQLWVWKNKQSASLLKKVLTVSILCPAPKRMEPNNIVLRILISQAQSLWSNSAWLQVQSFVRLNSCVSGKRENEAETEWKKKNSRVEKKTDEEHRAGLPKKPEEEQREDSHRALHAKC